MISRFLALNFSTDSFSILGEFLLTDRGVKRAKLAGKEIGKKRPDLLDYLTGLQQRFCDADTQRRAARAAALAEAALVMGAAASAAAETVAPSCSVRKAGAGVARGGISIARPVRPLACEVGDVGLTSSSQVNIERFPMCGLCA